MAYKLTFEDGSSAYLAHYGTKGMKWGVWNAETAARYRGGSIKENTPYNKYTKFAKGEGKDVVVPSGTTVYRMSNKRQEKNDSMRYVNVDETGRQYYRSSYGLDLKDRVYGKNTKIYENQYVVTEALKSPSLKKRTQILNEMYKDPDFRTEVAKVVLVRDYYANTAQYKGTINDAKKKVEGLINNNDPDTMKKMRSIQDTYDSSIKTLDKYQKADMAREVISGSRPMREKYATAVKAKGYNAILDDNGAFAGAHRIGDIPMIALDPSKTMRQVSSKEITRKQMQTEADSRMHQNALQDRAEMKYAARGNYYAKGAPPTVKEQANSVARKKKTATKVGYSAVAYASTIGAIALVAVL